MRCKKKANYIFQGFMAVFSRSAGLFLLYQDKRKLQNAIQTNIYLVIFNFPFEASTNLR
jgi:hypothetical protein